MGNYFYLGLFSKIFGSIFKALLKPVFSFISTLLSEVLSVVFEQILPTILKNVFFTIIQIIWNGIVQLVKGVLFKIFSFLLMLADNIEEVIEILLGAKTVKIDGKAGRFFEVLYELPQFKTVFWGLVGISILLIGAFVVYSMMRSSTSMTDPQADPNHNLSKAARSIAKALVTLFSGPFLVALMMTLTFTLSDVTKMIVKDVSAYGGDGKFGAAIFALAAVDNGDTSKMTEIYNGKVDYTEKSAVEKYIDLEDINYLIGIPGAVLLLIYMVSIGAGLARRVFDVIILFIVMPIFAASTVLDGGRRCERWREMMIGRMFIANGTYLVLLLASQILLPWVMRISIDTGSSSMLNTLLRILLVITILSSCTKFPELVTGMFDAHAASVDREMNNLGRDMLFKDNPVGKIL